MDANSSRQFTRHLLSDQSYSGSWHPISVGRFATVQRTVQEAAINKTQKIFGIFKTLLLCVFCTIPSRNAVSLKSELEESSRWLLLWCVSWCIPNHFCLLSSASNGNLHEFPSDRRKKKKKKITLWARASKLFSLWPIWPQGPFSPTRPIQAQTSCSAAGHRGGAKADYNQRKNTFNRPTTPLHFFGEWEH